MMTMANSDPMQFSGDAVGAAAIFAGAKPASNPSTVIERLNALLQSEIRTMENYASLAKHTTEAALIQMLQQLQVQHDQQCELLQQRIIELGGEPETSSGSRGIVSHAIHDTISAVGGQKAALWALHESENNILSDYAVSVDEVDPVTAGLISNQLIASQQRHVVALDEILKSHK